jgi:hypothetical protein
MDKLDPPCGPALLTEPKSKLRPVKQFPDAMNPAHVFTECRRQARKAVTEQLKREGRKLVGVSVRELQELAQDYLDQHREELIERAKRNLAR